MSFTPTFGGGINLDNEMYEEFKTVSGYVCNRLFSIGEDGFGTGRMAIIWNLYGRHQAFKKKLSQLKNRSCTQGGEPKGG